MDRGSLAGARRLVVKVGTSILSDPSGRLDLEGCGRVVEGIAAAAEGGHREVVLVSSGAIAAGMGRLGLSARPEGLAEKQALAAIGQGILIETYQGLFTASGLTAAQVLLTRDDFSHRDRYLNSRNTLLALLRFGAVPVVNENDTVAVEEIEFGDNDTLSALVAGLVDADLLVILTDSDGLYTADPRHDPEARLIREVAAVTPEIEALAQATSSRLARGGMITKVEAARTVVRSGIPLVIASGRRPGVLPAILAGEETGTLFKPGAGLHSRKRWIAFGHKTTGRLMVDDGACKALTGNGKSLLPSGIVAVEGDFRRGNTVSILDRQGREIARGIANYSSGELLRIKGFRSDRIAEILGYRRDDEAVHRDNLVVLEGGVSG